MEQDNLVPLSSLIASMLLVKDEVSSVEVTNVMSELEQLGTNIDDSDDIDALDCCVEMNDDFSFRFKEGFDYDTVLDSGIKVSDFLFMQSNCKINLLLKNSKLLDDREEVPKVIVKPKFKVRSLVRGISLSMFR